MYTSLIPLFPSRWCGRWKPGQRGEPCPGELHLSAPPPPPHAAVPPHTPSQGHPGAGQQRSGHTHSGEGLRTAVDTHRTLHPLASFA